MDMSAIPVARLRGAVKRYGALAAVDGLDLSLHRGELLALLGPTAPTRARSSCSGWTRSASRRAGGSA